MSKTAKYDQKSGVNSVTDYVSMHGGLPEKKSVEQIEKVFKQALEDITKQLTTGDKQ